MAALRAGVDGRPERLKGVLMEEGLRRECLGGVGRGEGKVVKAFVEGNREGMLKTKPRVCFLFLVFLCSPDGGLEEC